MANISFAHTAETREIIAAVCRLSMARDLHTIMTIVRTAARRVVGADGATFVLREGDLVHYADEDAISPLWKGRRFSMSACISGWAILNRASAMIEDVYSDARIPADAYRPTFVKSLLMVPIRMDDPIGAIGTYWAHPHTASSEELQLLQALADSTAVAIENVQLYEGLKAAKQEAEAKTAAAVREIARRETAELQLHEKIRELEAFHDATVGRELKMMDLEREVEQLRQECARLKRTGL
jgi:GAF domain-containing protein